ncbi:MAG: T9SS type A sorting domain-containing protein [Sphingobacteriaceae bacterium]
MKIILKASQLVLLFSIIGRMAMAQPTLTSQNSNPLVGDQFEMIRSQSPVSPGGSGANQSWTLTGFSNPTSVTITALSVSSTPSGSLFPIANICLFDGTQYNYYNNTINGQEIVGIATSNPPISFNNPEQNLSFPNNYGSSTFDNFEYTFILSNTTQTVVGSKTITTDGYGSLTTPFGNYQNVLRINTVRTWTTYINPSLFSFFSEQVFEWYSPNIHMPIARTSTVTFSNGVFFNSSYLKINPNVTSINELKNEVSEVKIYPNPVSSVANISIYTDYVESVNIEIRDIRGVLMRVQEKEQLNRGLNNINMDLSEFNSGVYYINFILNNTTFKSKIIKL